MPLKFTIRNVDTTQTWLMNQSRVALTYFESFESFREEILNTHKNKKDELSALPYQRININNTHRTWPTHQHIWSHQHISTQYRQCNNHQHMHTFQQSTATRDIIFSIWEPYVFSWIFDAVVLCIAFSVCVCVYVCLCACVYVCVLCIWQYALCVLCVCACDWLIEIHSPRMRLWGDISTFPFHFLKWNCQKSIFLVGK